MKKYQRKDHHGTVFTIMVRDDNQVVMFNDARVPLSLANAAFMIAPYPGTKEASQIVRDAARKSVFELSRVTKLQWTQIG